eukprot:gene120-177_t
MLTGMLSNSQTKLNRTSKRKSKRRKESFTSIPSGDRNHDLNGNVPLQWALWGGSIECFNVNFNQALISWRIMNRHLIEYIQLLIDNGADVNRTDQDGSVPLQLALIGIEEKEYRISISLISLCIRHDYPIEYIQLLIDHGADVNAVTDGSVPLQLALERKNIECMKLLIEHGADFNVLVATVFNINQTLISWCIMNRRPIEYIQLLIGHGADVNAVTNGTSVLSKCIQSYSHPCLVYVGLLIDHGADVNKRNQNGSVPLQLAIDRKNIECMKLLIDHGADVNAVTNNGMSLLSKCVLCYNKHLEYSWTLITNGADVNFTTTWGPKVVDLAVHNKNTVQTRLLIRHGARLTYGTKNYLHKERLKTQIKAEDMMSMTIPTPLDDLSEDITERDTSRENRFRLALSKACEERDMEVALCLVAMGVDPWSVDTMTITMTTTKKDLQLSEPWEGYYAEELERVWRRRMFISLSVVDACRDSNNNINNLFKWLKDRNLDVWRISSWGCPLLPYRHCGLRIYMRKHFETQLLVKNDVKIVT